MISPSVGIGFQVREAKPRAPETLPFGENGGCKAQRERDHPGCTTLRSHRRRSGGRPGTPLRRAGGSAPANPRRRPRGACPARCPPAAPIARNVPRTGGTAARRVFARDYRRGRCGVSPLEGGASGTTGPDQGEGVPPPSNQKKPLSRPAQRHASPSKPSRVRRACAVFANGTTALRR